MFGAHPLVEDSSLGAATLSANRFCFYHCIPTSGGRGEKWEGDVRS